MCERVPHSQVERIIDNCKPLYVQADGTLWASRGYDLYRILPGTTDLEWMSGYKPPLSVRLFKRHRLTRRLGRLGYHHLLPVAGGEFLAIFKGVIVKIDGQSGILRKVFDIPRGCRPLGLAQGEDGFVCWGEYFSNNSHESVHIYGSSDHGETWYVVYTFKANEILHIHNVIYDHIRKGYWVLTGDLNAECKIAFTSDRFSTLDVLLSGSQDTRSVCAFPMAEGLLVITDTPLAQNRIYMLDLRSQKTETITELPASVFYGARVGNGFVISTAHEGSRVNTTPYVHLYYSPDGHTWHEFHCGRKDKWSHRLFQHGLYHFPAGPNPGPYIYASGQAIEGEDEKLLVWDIRKNHI